EKELQEFDAIHIEMIELRGFSTCFAIKRTAPPHRQEIDNRRTTKEGLSDAVQSGIHQKLLYGCIAQNIGMRDVVFGRLDGMLTIWREFIDIPSNVIIPSRGNSAARY